MQEPAVVAVADATRIRAMVRCARLVFAAGCVAGCGPRASHQPPVLTHATRRACWRRCRNSTKTVSLEARLVYTYSCSYSQINS